MDVIFQDLYFLFLNIVFYCSFTFQITLQPSNSNSEIPLIHLANLQ